MIVFGIILILCTVLSVCVLIFTNIGFAKYEEYILPLRTEKKYPFCDLYGLGFYLLEKVGYSYDSKLDRKRIAQCKIIYGEQYGEYYYRVNMAQKVTFSVLVFLVVLILSALSRELIFAGCAVFAAVCVFFYVDALITKVMAAREESFERSFPEMVSKLTLLINAGMIMREAWAEVAYASEGLIYEEMRATWERMQNGTPEAEAYIYFGSRCGTKKIKKFTSMLVQNLTKGNRELIGFLKQSTKESWMERKNFAKRKGEAAAVQLIGPIALMFIGLLIMIVVPIFGNISAG